MTTISSSTTSTTAYKVTADTTGALVLQTGATPTTAVTISSSQVVSLANALPVASGGTGVTTSTGTGANVLGTSPTISSPTINGTPVMGASIITSGTAVASTSGTSIDFTSLPSWIKRITLIFNGVSLSGTSQVIVQLGSTTFTTSGYICNGTAFQGAGSPVSTANTTGFGIEQGNGAAVVIYGNVIITNISSNTWVASGCGGASNGANVRSWLMGGNVSLGGTLDRVRFTTVGGTNTFDLGSINILYE